MKLAFVVINANRHEGTSRAVLEVAERLANVHQVDLWARTVDGAAKVKLHWIGVPGPGRPEIADFASFHWVANRRLARSSYDIIHSAGPNVSCADVYTIQTVHPVKMKLMESARAQQPAGFPRRLSWKLYDQFVIRSESRAYMAVGARGLRAFLPVSNGTRHELLTQYPKSERIGSRSNIEVVPNGADLEMFHPRKRSKYRDSVRRKHELSKNDFVLLFSGGDWRRKGLDLAIRSLTLLPERRIKLLVAGDDRNGAEIRKLVDSLQLNDRVRFVGFQPNVDQYYAAADLFVFPTMYEAFSLATIEAAGSGLPVLMPDVSGAQELIGTGNTGTVIQRNPQNIADSVMRYFQSPGLLHRASIAARQLVEREFSWDAIAAKTLAMYEYILTQRVESNANAKLFTH